MIFDLDIEIFQHSLEKENQEIMEEEEEIKEINLDNLMIPIPFFWPVFI